MYKVIMKLFVAAVAVSPFVLAAHEKDETPLALMATDPSLKWGPCPPVFSGACELAVVRGDPAKPNADVMLRIAPVYELPRHRHSSAERMVLLEGELVVKYDGADAVTLTPATYAYGPAGLPHEGKCVSQSRCTLFIAFEGPVDAELVPPGQ
jgi:quercetin dioxygenase-like cupin family protein